MAQKNSNTKPTINKNLKKEIINSYSNYVFGATGFACLEVLYLRDAQKGLTKTKDIYEKALEDKTLNKLMKRYEISVKTLNNFIVNFIKDKKQVENVYKKDRKSFYSISDYKVQMLQAMGSSIFVNTPKISTFYESKNNLDFKDDPIEIQDDFNKKIIEITDIENQYFELRNKEKRNLLAMEFQIENNYPMRNVKFKTSKQNYFYLIEFINENLPTKIPNGLNLWRDKEGKKYVEINAKLKPISNGKKNRNVFFSKQDILSKGGRCLRKLNFFVFNEYYFVESENKEYILNYFKLKVNDLQKRIEQIISILTFTKNTFNDVAKKEKSVMNSIKTLENNHSRSYKEEEELKNLEEIHKAVNIIKSDTKEHLRTLRYELKQRQIQRDDILIALGSIKELLISYKQPNLTPLEQQVIIEKFVGNAENRLIIRAKEIMQELEHLKTFIKKSVQEIEAKVEAKEQSL